MRDAKLNRLSIQGKVNIRQTMLNDPEVTSSVPSAHEALREADRRKGEFLATLAHELRSEFVIRLPLLSGAQAVAPEPSVGPSFQPTPARRVLIVDDNRDSAESLATLRRSLG